MAMTAEHTVQGASVLLVDDNEINRQVGNEFLQSMGLMVRLADSGAAAIAACAAHPPAVVLMDLEMPGMTGLEAARRLRQMQREGSLSGFPIIALTAHEQRRHVNESVAAGMNGFLSKPLMLDAVRRELGRWLPELSAA